MNIILYVSEYSVHDIAELDKFFSKAEADALEKNILSAIFLRADNGCELGITVGGDETVLSFDYGDPTKPYLASKGISNDFHPVLTVYAYFTHYTEFPRKYVIPFKDGLKAAYEFFETNELPACVEWMEV